MGTPRKFTPAQADEMMALVASGMSRSKIAERFDVTRNVICGRIFRLSKERQGRPMQEDEDAEPAENNPVTRMMNALDEVESELTPKERETLLLFKRNKLIISFDAVNEIEGCREVCVALKDKGIVIAVGAGWAVTIAGAALVAVLPDAKNPTARE